MPPSTPPLTLSEAFQLRPGGELISFVGGGGKTTLMMALGRELAAAGHRVVGTSTTHMARDEVRGAPALCLVRDLEGLPETLRQHPFCLVVSEVGQEKARGVPPGLPGQLLAGGEVTFVLVEADGAKRLPVKAPEAHEPVLPPQTTLLVPVVGIDALEGPLGRVAHRPHLVARLTGRTPQEMLRAQDVARLLTHREGGLKGAPPGARIIPFINKVERPEQVALAREIARLVVRHERIGRVLLGAAQRAPAGSGPVMGIVE